MLDTRNAKIRVLAGEGAAGSERLFLDQDHLAIGDNGRLALMDCWVTGRGNVVRPSPTAIWGRLNMAGQVIAPPVGGSVVQKVVAGYPALSFPSAANQFLLGYYSLPPSYAVYCIVRLATATLTAPFGQQDPAGDGMLLEMNGGAIDLLRLRHEGSASGARIEVTNGFSHSGAISVVWGCFRSSDLQAAIGGMDGANIKLAPLATGTLDRQHKISDRCRFGMASSSNGHSIYDIIIFPEPLYYSNNDAHQGLLVAIAAAYGKTTEA